MNRKKTFLQYVFDNHQLCVYLVSCLILILGISMIFIPLSFCKDEVIEDDGLYTVKDIAMFRNYKMIILTHEDITFCIVVDNQKELPLNIGDCINIDKLSKQVSSIHISIKDKQTKAFENELDQYADDELKAANPIIDNNRE